MPQFDAESLSRVLRQVEREVLSEAAERANIDPLLTTPRGETLDELQGYFNLASNLAVLGPQALKLVLTEKLEDFVEDLPQIPFSFGILPPLAAFFVGIQKNIELIASKLEIGSPEGIPMDFIVMITFLNDISIDAHAIFNNPTNEVEAEFRARRIDKNVHDFVDVIDKARQ